VQQKLQLKRGDLIVQKQNDGSWSANKIIELETWPDGSPTVHCMAFASLPDKPDVETLRHAQILIGHAPVDAASYESGWELVGNEPPTLEELGGYHSYLEQTNPAKYVSVMEKLAKEYFLLGYEAEQRGDKEAAIAEYTNAIDVWPSFFPAINNLAVLYLERRDYELALREFEFALKIQPDNGTIPFSIGECCLKIGEKLAEQARAKLDKAAEIFAEGRNRFPEQRAYFEEFLKKVQAIRGKGI
jgi:tetratricopeptide (TPR) repeat protein